MNTSTTNKFLCFLQNEEGKPCVLPVVLEVEQEMVNKASRVVEDTDGVHQLKNVRKKFIWKNAEKRR